VRSHQHLGNSLSVERQRIGGERRYPVFSVFHPAKRLNMIPSSAPPFFQIHKSQGIGYGMNSVGTAAIKKLEVICGAEAKRGLSGSGGLCPFLWEQPSADQVNNTVSVPTSFPTFFCLRRLLMASIAVPTTTRLKLLCFKNVRKRSCMPRSSSTTNTVGWPCLSWRRMSWSRADFLTRQRPPI
jgi:hypothetical protein